MALTTDIALRQVGVPKQPKACPVLTGQTIYHGGVALAAGTGGNAGLLKNAATPLATDVVMGMVDQITGGTGVETGPGITGAASNATFVDVRTGTFLFTSDTGGDALTEANAGQTVYYGGEGTGTVIASATSGGNTRPVLGTMQPIDPTVPAGMVPVTLAAPGI